MTDVLSLAKFGAMIAKNGVNCLTGESMLKYF